MLKDRIISTLRFFDLQDYPLTLLEIHKFLIADMENLKTRIDGQGEIVSKYKAEAEILADKILECLDSECVGEVQNTLGFYHLSGKQELVNRRLSNYAFGLKREKLVKKYARGLRHMPFIRGAALGGSQALGLQKPTSDIDLLIITDARFLWLGRTMATIYFQILGKRRHGAKITNRFCLNHYLAGPKALDQIKNLYSAMEYSRLRPLVYPNAIAAFQQNNAFWIRQCFPQCKPVLAGEDNTSTLQNILEKLFTNPFGVWLESKLKAWQEPRIKKQKFIIVEDDELSFHPDSKQKPLLEKFLFEP
ncbi:MAG TPA: nucleotidyltransferase domain-containing protein [Candidatus Limnocylindria bacterium]|nr:nucleotidyltransferase domain-containing protein [Candidatus Limnocylindria bacterium]